MNRYSEREIPILLLCVLAAACGGEDAAQPVAPGPSMSANTTVLDVATVEGAQKGGNSAPILKSIRFEPVQPTSGEPLRVIADTFDADGDAVGLSYMWSYQGKEVRGDSAQMTFLQSKKRDWIEVTVTPNDGKVEGVPMTAETRVLNRAPSAVSLRMEPSTKIQAGMPIVARPHSHDFDGDAVVFKYRWTVNGHRQPGESDTLDSSHLKRGDVVQVTVVASDGDADSPPVLSEELTISNAPPQIVSQPSRPEEDGLFRYQLEVRDADDRRFRYRLVRSPEGMEVDQVSGLVEWKPRDDQVGSFPVEIMVDDRKGGSSRQSFELTLAKAAEGSQDSPASLPE